MLLLRRRRAFGSCRQGMQAPRTVGFWGIFQCPPDDVACFLKPFLSLFSPNPRGNKVDYMYAKAPPLPLD